MTEEEEARAIARQEAELGELRKQLEPICEKAGYSLAQACKGVALAKYQKDVATNIGAWDGLRAPKDWFLKGEGLDADAYWKLSPVERKKRLEKYPTSR